MFKWCIYNTSHKFWDQSTCPHYQCCLQVSETVSWYKFWCCYSANILQHWAGGGRTWFISITWNIPEFPEIFPRIESVSIIYVRYCRWDLSSENLFWLIRSATGKYQERFYMNSPCNLSLTITEAAWERGGVHSPSWKLGLYFVYICKADSGYFN